MNSNMNKWMEFANENAKLINNNFEVMNKFWTASLEETTDYTEKNVETFFDHMNNNVELMQDIYKSTTKTNKKLKPLFQKNIAKLNTRIQEIYTETMKTVNDKIMSASK